jgi:hypothetical protein
MSEKMFIFPGNQPNPVVRRAHLALDKLHEEASELLFDLQGNLIDGSEDDFRELTRICSRTRKELRQFAERTNGP